MIARHDLKALSKILDMKVGGRKKGPTVRRDRRQKYLHPKQQSMTVRILDLIQERGGMTGGQIKRQLWEWSHPGQTYDKRVTACRNWWNTNLYGNYRHKGLLHFYCDKQGGRWVRNSVPHEDQPWKVLRKQSAGSWSQWSTMPSGGQYIMTFNPPATAQGALP